MGLKESLKATQSNNFFFSEKNDNFLSFEYLNAVKGKGETFEESHHSELTAEESTELLSEFPYNLLDASMPYIIVFKHHNSKSLAERFLINYFPDSFPQSTLQFSSAKFRQAIHQMMPSLNYVEFGDADSWKLK